MNKYGCIYFQIKWEVLSKIKDYDGMSGLSIAVDKIELKLICALTYLRV